jgi:nuclear pore complex protein Nup188
MAYLDQDVDLQVNEDPYLASPDLLGMIHNTVLDAANANLITASPVIFAWSLILHRMYVAYQERAERRDLAQNQRAQDGFELENHPYNTGRRNSAGSIVSIEKSPYDIFLANSSLERDMQVVEQLAMAVTSRGLVYDLIADMAICMGNSQHAAFRPVVGPRARLVFLELLKASFPVAGYKSEPVSALLLTLSGGQQYWDISNDSPLPPEREVTALTLNDPLLLEYYVYQSLHRYPYEFLPFTQMCRVFSSSLCSGEGSEIILNFLLKTPSLTFEFDKKWDNYELAQEVDNSNTIRLLRSEYLFTPSSPRRRPLSDEESFCIPAKTIGRFVTDGGKVVLLEYGHSTLALLGKRLEVNTTPDAYKPQPLGFLQPEETAEAINLLATLLRVSVLKAQGPTPEEVSGAGLKLLKEMSKALPRTKDIITVICDTLDNTIQGELADSEGADISVITSCLRFLHSALPLTPGRVWSYMARCELLNSESRAGRLSRITGNLDLLSERYDLLVSSVNLFSSLVSSARSSAVQRRIGTRPSSRQKIEEDPWLGTSDKIFSRICLSIAQTSVDIYENSATWRFASEVHRSIVVRDVVGTMNDLVTFSHSMGPPGEPKGLTGCLLPAAKYIIDTFLSPSSGTLRFQPLLASLLVAFQIPDTTLYPRREHIMTDRLVVVLRFATSLLRIADYLGQASQTIQKQLFKVASLVARLYAVRDAFRLPSLSLLGALVESAGKGNSEPPSLLGYLGPQISRSLIQILSTLDKPLDRLTTTVGIWKFFSAIMRNRQQWMANCLLTGKTPREALEGNGRISKVHQDSVLHAALARLASISSIPSEETLAILDFFTSAQNYWPWTIFAMQKDNSFLDSLRSYVHDLKAPSIVSKSNPGEAAYQARIASYIAETFAMQLYHLRQMGREEIFARDVVNDLDYFLRDGVQVSGYNTSLHVNFSRNFASRYSGCSLEDFKTTVLSPRNLGPQYYYALDHADAMLDFDASWIGPRRNGFRHEMETANLNLSLVDAQIVSTYTSVLPTPSCTMLTLSRPFSMPGSTCSWNSVSASYRRIKRSPSKCCKLQRSASSRIKPRRRRRISSFGSPSRGPTCP